MRVVIPAFLAIVVGLIENTEAQLFEVLPLDGAPVQNFALSRTNTIIEIDLSHAKERLAELSTNKDAVVYLSLAAVRPSETPLPSWQVFFVGVDEAELIRPQTQIGVYPVCSSTNGLHFLGNLKLRHKDHRGSYAIRRGALESIVRSGGKAYLMFFLNPGPDEAQLAKKPVKVTKVRFEVQRVMAKQWR